MVKKGEEGQNKRVKLVWKVKIEEESKNNSVL